LPAERLRRDLQRLMRHGDIVYIYTGIGKVYAYSGDLELLEERLSEYLQPREDVTAKVKYVPHGSRSWGRGVSGTYHEVRKRMISLLEKYGAFERIHVSLMVRIGALLRLVNVSYTFLVDTVEKLDLVLRNAFSVPRIVEELGALPE